MTKFYGFVTLVVCMIFMSMTSVMNAAVYLLPGDCAQGNEEWWAYTWTDGIPNDKGEVSKSTEFWTQGAVGSDGKVTFDLSDKGYNLIFVRMNPERGGNEPSFDYRLNQTADLSVMEESTYELTGFGEGNLMNGQWQKVASVTNKTIWQQTNANAANFLIHRRALTGRHCMVNKLVSVVEVANWVKGLDNMTDEDLTNDAVFPSVASVGVGLVVAVDLGRVYPKTQQVGLIMDSKTYLAGVKLGSWITIKTYLNGVEKDKQTDWSVLGVNAIGYGDKSYIFFNPTSEFDEVRITIANVANLLEFNSKYYGLFIRNDYDGDGTPDCKDDDSCAEEYTLDEEATELRKPKDYIEGNLVLHRSFEINNWNCITLPVDLTWLQVRNAFGNGVRIATPEGFYYSPYIGADGTKYSVLYYNPRTDKDGDIALEKNKYYVIYPEREPDLADGTYTAQDGITVNAPIYFIPKVTYLREAELAGGVVEPMTVNYKKFNNGSNAPMMMADENTNEVPQIILHGSQVYLDDHVNSNVAAGDNYLYSYNNTFTRVSDINGVPMRGFRFYAENHTPYPITHERGTDLDTPTGIVNIVSPAKMPEGVLHHRRTHDSHHQRHNQPAYRLLHRRWQKSGGISKITPPITKKSSKSSFEIYNDIFIMYGRRYKNHVKVHRIRNDFLHRQT